MDQKNAWQKSIDFMLAKNGLKKEDVKMKSPNNYKNMVPVILCIFEQIKYLESIGFGFSFLEKSDVKKINKKLFVISNYKNILFLEKDSHIISIPFSKTNPEIYYSPELQNITALPCRIPKQSMYYSIASFVIDMLFHVNISLIHEFEDLRFIHDPLFVNEKYHVLQNTMDLLHPIRYTKLYWLLVRLLHQEPRKRIFLYA